VKIIASLSRLAEFVGGVLGFLPLLLVCYEVVGRYFAPRLLTDWGAEVTVYLVIWGVFLSFGELARKNEHVSADFLVANLKGAWQARLEVFLWIIGFIYSAVLVFAGWKVVGFALMLGETGDTSLHFPKAYYYLALPVGMAIQCVVYMVFLGNRLRAKNTSEDT
jgi:TRAP-type C4-dicarboxylate transport system permease small subunit